MLREKRFQVFGAEFKLFSVGAIFYANWHDVANYSNSVLLETSFKEQELDKATAFWSNWPHKMVAPSLTFSQKDLELWSLRGKTMERVVSFCKGQSPLSSVGHLDLVPDPEVPCPVQPLAIM